MRNVSVLAPASFTNPTIVNGRPCRGSGNYPECDADILCANGWTRVGMVGATSQRPTPLDPDMQTGVPNGLVYIDTTLGKTIRYDATNKVWIDPVTGGAV